MKKYLTGFLSIAFAVLLASNVMSYSGSYVPGAGINNTVHDLGVPGNNGMSYGASPADPLQRICIYCHAPHNTYRLSAANGGLPADEGSGPIAGDAFDYLPLWNHELQADTGYKVYDNGPGAPQTGDHASQAILSESMAPGSTSLLCLSCHDGSVAVNSYGNSSQLDSSRSTGTTIMSPQYRIGYRLNLTNHHPIGFDYDNVQNNDTEIRVADAAMLTPTSFVRDHLYGGVKMECGTCHSVHNKGNGGETLLWRSDQNSELCLTCHDKGTYVAP